MTSTRPSPPRSAPTSTAAEVVDGIDLTGKRAIVTGGASGIGVETARALAGAGAEVTLAVRNVEAGRDAPPPTSPRPPATSRCSSPGSTSPTRPPCAAFAPAGRARWTSSSTTRASWPSPLMRTPEGWEMQFATNHLRPLRPGHPAARRPGRGRRPGSSSVSSSAHLRSPVVLRGHPLRAPALRPVGRPTASRRPPTCCSPSRATKRWAADGITVNALQPGGIRTNLQRYVTDEELDRMRRASRRRRPDSWKTVEQGAATSRAAWRPRRCSTASAAATSRTATRPSPTSPAPAAASRPTPSTPRSPRGCGTSRSRRSTCRPVHRTA